MSHTVLIVEDDTTLGSILKEKLTNSGYTVSLVTDGSQALPTMKSGRPDIVLLDIMLPGMNGSKSSRQKLLTQR